LDTDRPRQAAHLNRHTTSQENLMEDEPLNLSIRKFLKLVGVSSQREIEQAVAAAIASKALGGSETLPIKMTLEMPTLQLKVPFEGTISLK
jgi:Family of unknown function (DUF6494)